jgi:LysR family transcriptional regulator, low CO2-responsive transcriptional regulator
MQLDLDALEAFAVFADTPSFTRVARRLGLTQPAVHARIRRLTEAVGQVLYVRDGRTLVLTPAGRRTAEFAREWRSRVARFAEELAPEGPRPVQLAAGEGAYLYLLDGALRRFRRGDARLQLRVTDADAALAAVRGGEVDLAVASLDEAPSGLDAECIAELPQVLAVARDHPLASRRRVRLAELAALPWIAPPRGRPQRAWLEAAMREQGQVLEVAIEAQGWPLTLRLVALGAGVAIVNRFAEPPRELAFVPVVGVPPRRYWALRRRELLHDEAARLWSILVG